MLTMGPGVGRWVALSVQNFMNSGHDVINLRSSTHLANLGVGHGDIGPCDSDDGRV